MPRLFRESLAVFLCTVMFYLPLLSLNAPKAAATTNSATVKTSKTSLQQLRAHKPGELLIKFRENVSPAQREQILNTFAKEQKDLRGRAELKRLKLKDGLDVTNTLNTARQLDQLIEWAEPNYLVVRSDSSNSKTSPGSGKTLLRTGKARPRAGKARQNASIPNDPHFATQWALANDGRDNGLAGSDIGALAGWQKTKGSRQGIVAVIDTGVEVRHPDIYPNLWKNQAELNGEKNKDDDGNGYKDDAFGWNFVNDSNDVSDDNGHGTAMSGIIGAVTDNRFGIAGVMWETNVMALKALDATGSGSIADVVEAMDYAVTHGAQVINCSFGTEGYSQALYDAIQRAAVQGVLVVASAGNAAQDIGLNPYYPAGYSASNLITVAATNNNDQLATFSNWSQEKVHLGAPGVGILTTARGGGFNTLTGTSAAAPLVAGAAGLLKSLRPWVSAATARQSLILGARKVAALNGKVTSGGVVNLGGAIEVFLKGGRGKDDPDDPGGGGPGGGPGGGGPGDGGPGQVPPGILDYMRNNRPNTPEPRVTINNVPSSPYDDPEPGGGGGGGFAGYYTEEHKYYNSVGRAGAKTAEDPDPTGGSTTGSQSVNLGSQNVNFVAPVLSLPGRAGLDLNLSLTYNSNVWVKSGTTLAFNLDKTTTGPGWRIGFGAIEGINSGSSITPFYDAVSAKNAFMYVEPDGTRHILAYSTGTKYLSYDSTYLEYDDSSKVLKLMNGTQISFETPMYAGSANGRRLLPKKIKDRNGNCITITNAEIVNGNGIANNTHEWDIDSITDTLGRVIDFHYESNLLREVRQQRGAAWFKYLIISYAAVTLAANSTAFASGITTDPSTLHGTQVWVPWYLTYPNQSSQRFFYTSYGQVYQIEKWAPTVSGQGSERAVAFSRYNLPTVSGYSSPAGALTLPPNVGTLPSDCPEFSLRQEWAENWSPTSATPGWTAQTSNGGGITFYVAQYEYQYYPASNYSLVIDPLGRYFRTDVSTDRLTHTVKQYESLSAYNAGVMLKTTEVIYTKDTGLGYDSNLRVTSTKITASGNIRYTTVGYDTTAIAGVALPNDVSEYQGNTSTVYRHTQTTYENATAYLNAHIYGLPKETRLYKGAGTANLVSKMGYTYDESGYFDTTNYSLSATIHDGTNYGTGFITGRGNVTTVTQYEVPGAGTKTTRTKYDKTGNPVSVFDGLNKETRLYYENNFDITPGIGETRGPVTRVRDADSYWSGAKYHYYSGNVLESYHLPGTSGTGTKENRYAYTYDSFDRRNATYRPDGGGVVSDYWDNWLSRADYTLTSGTTYRYNFTAWDGAGQVRWQGGDHPNGVTGRFTIKRFQYGLSYLDDNAGQPLLAHTKETNPTEVDGSLNPAGDDASAGYRWTTQWYDRLDRVRKVRTADYNKVDYVYTACTCAGYATTRIIDQRDKTRDLTYDFLGRLDEAREHGTYPWPLLGKAKYIYDERDLLQRIEHYNNGTAKQERFFEYDGYGRLWKQRTPETNHTNYVYTYFANDLVQTVTDPRGAAATYAYNNRNLLSDVTYSVPGGVAFTPNVHYDYGEYGQRTLMQEKNGSTVIGSTSYAYNHATMRTQLTGETRSFNGLGGTYQLGYSFNMEDDLTAVTYTAGAWSKTVNYGYNGIGAPTKIGTNLVSIGGLDTTNNVMRNLTFRAFGALKDADYGNQQRVELSYHSDRLNLTRLKVYKSTPIPVNIIDKNYDYYNGGAHNGRLQKVTDALDSSFTTTYTYDDRNRLTKAQSGTVLTRDYGYDNWGNLTSATMSGTSNTLASYTLNYAANGTGAPTTNRINTITEGIGYSVSHDSSGNLTSDNSTGATYTYDGAARLATATTATSGYEYDGDGWRVKQTANSTPTYYLWSSVFGQPALELNSSGNVVRAYVFSSSGQRVALQASNGSFYWVHGDHLGSSHKLTDTSGNVAYTAEYDPHGNLRFESGTTTLTTRKFTGYERDAANLDFAQARSYGYRRGRFMQPDPLMLGAGDATNPQSLNLYSYVQNDPINLVDPTGLNCRAYTYEWSGWIGDTYHINQTSVVWVCDGNFGGGGGGGGEPIGGGGGSGGGYGGDNSNNLQGPSGQSFSDRYDLGKLLPCLADAGVNLGIGSLLALAGPVGLLVKAGLDLTGTDINPFQRAAGNGSLAEPFGGTDLLAGATDLSAAGAQAAYQGAGGDAGLNKAKDLVNRKSFKAASVKTQTKRLTALKGITTLGKAARILPPAAIAAELLDAGVAAYDCFQKAKKN